MPLVLRCTASILYAFGLRVLRRYRTVLARYAPHTGWHCYNRLTSGATTAPHADRQPADVLLISVPSADPLNAPYFFFYRAAVNILSCCHHVLRLSLAGFAVFGVVRARRAGLLLFYIPMVLPCLVPVFLDAVIFTLQFT